MYTVYRAGVPISLKKDLINTNNLISQLILKAGRTQLSNLKTFVDFCFNCNIIIILVRNFVGHDS